jgi:RimJ/RimL family protein N-acetyltransferase
VISVIHEENAASIAVTNKLGGALVGIYEGPLLLFEYACPAAVRETEG